VFYELGERKLVASLRVLQSSKASDRLALAWSLERVAELNWTRQTHPNEEIAASEFRTYLLRRLEG